MKKSKLEIIEETAAFYSEDPTRRGVEDGVCEYLTHDDRRCAVGRCLAVPDFSLCGDVRSLWDADASLDEALKPEYRGHSRHFWSALQFFHDVEEHWTETGLSADGIRRLATLKERWADNAD